MIEALKACTPHSRSEHVLERPNHQEPPSDSDKFIAKENLLLDHHQKNRVIEEASADKETVRFSNTMAADNPAKDSETSKIEQMGPLTFDPCPEIEPNKQQVPIASDKQAELIHWH